MVINGVAKTYAMTGWRVGWMIAPADVTKAAANLQSHTTSNVCNVAQRAALAAVGGDLSAVEVMRATYDRRRRTIVGMLNDIPGVRCPEPHGAFYAFPSMEGLLGRPLGRPAGLPPRRWSWRPSSSTRHGWRSSPGRPLAPRGTAGSLTPSPMRPSPRASPVWPSSPAAEARGCEVRRGARPGNRGDRRGRAWPCYEPPATRSRCHSAWAPTNWSAPSRARRR